MEDSIFFWHVYELLCWTTKIINRRETKSVYIRFVSVGHDVELNFVYCVILCLTWPAGERLTSTNHLCPLRSWTVTQNDLPSAGTMVTTRARMLPSLCTVKAGSLEAKPRGATPHPSNFTMEIEQVYNKFLNG